MADQGKWFKLWESSLDDQDLENLSIHEWFCWARFGTYLKKHGKDGKIRLRAPATAVTNLLRLPSFKDVVNTIKRFPNYTITPESETANVTNEFVTYNITCLHWLKYQGDYSTERVRRYRSRETANVTPQEERRGEETKSLSPKGSSSPKSAALRSAPPDAPAPLRATSVDLVEDERRQLGHGDFLQVGWRKSGYPADHFDWEHLERSLDRTEQVQSRLREKIYHERERELAAIQLANSQEAKATPHAPAAVQNGADDDVF